MMERCGICRFFVKDNDEKDSGDCRRHAPLVTGGMMSDKETVWPHVDRYDGCGDYELDR